MHIWLILFRFFHCLSVDLPLDLSENQGAGQVAGQGLTQASTKFYILQSNQDWQIHQTFDPLPFNILSKDIQSAFEQTCAQAEKINQIEEFQKQIDRMIDRSRQQNPIIQNRLFLRFLPSETLRIQALFDRLFRIDLAKDRIELKSSIDQKLWMVDVKALRHSQVRGTRQIKALDFEPMSKLLERYVPAVHQKKYKNPTLVKLLIEFRAWYREDQTNHQDLGILQTVIFEALVRADRFNERLAQMRQKNCQVGDLLTQKIEKAIHQPDETGHLLMIRGFQSCFLSDDLLWHDWAIDLKIDLPIEFVQMDLSYFEKAFEDISLFPLLAFQNQSGQEMIGWMKVGALMQH